MSDWISDVCSSDPELGGGRFAQVTAAVAVCCVPFSMLAGSMLQYTSPDYLWWVLAAWLLLKLANGGDPRWWLGLGLAIGLGMMTRYTMLLCVAGIDRKSQRLISRH